jgi:hypothetical protein
MASPKFHLAIDSPPGMAFPSFPSSALEGGDVKKITLDMIRNKCSMYVYVSQYALVVEPLLILCFPSSNKLFFTVDGKSRVEDTTTLAYYMSLTSEVGFLFLSRLCETKRFQG